MLHRKISDLSVLLELIFLLIFSCRGYCDTTLSTLDEQVDTLISNIPDDYYTQADTDRIPTLLKRFGPDVVPVITKRLNDSLSEGASEQGSKVTAIMEMPADDQRRVLAQEALIALQSEALQNLPLSDQVASSVRESLYRALKSPYEGVRRHGLGAVAWSIGKQGVTEMLPMLNDPENSIRLYAAEMLSRTGDASTADKMQVILDKRKQGLTEKQINYDDSFRYGYEAVKKLRNGVVSNSSPTSSHTAVHEVGHSPAISTTQEPPKTPEPNATTKTSVSESNLRKIVWFVVAPAILIAIGVYYARKHLTPGE